ncbi:hypothetical protein SGPA1_40879 [Streptomyces misionensis JCM 4497]
MTPRETTGAESAAAAGTAWTPRHEAAATTAAAIRYLRGGMGEPPGIQPGRRGGLAPDGGRRPDTLGEDMPMQGGTVVPPAPRLTGECADEKLPGSLLPAVARGRLRFSNESLWRNGFGSGMTCRRRPAGWAGAGARPRLHEPRRQVGRPSLKTPW